MRGSYGQRMLGTAMAFMTLTATANEPPTLTTLPNPLTLEQALTLADAAYPALQSARAELGLAQARRLDAGARYGTRAYVEITPEAADPSTGGGFLDDSRARLVVQQPVYDFGYTRALTAAAEAGVVGGELHLLDAHQQHRIDIMQRYHDVILADLRASVELEEMTHRFLNFNRFRERHALGQVSDLDLLEAEHPYREALIQRTASQHEQLASRQRLALALNRPGEIPNELVTPGVAPTEREIPGFNALYESAASANPALLALQKEVNSAQAGLVAARAHHGPTLTAELELGKYQRALPARGDVRAGLTLRIPLLQSGDTKAALARAQAELATRQARLLRAEHQLRQAALELVQRLQTLKVERATAQQRLAFRELSLDRRRALYEMEVQARLGDALTRLTEAQWFAMKANLDILLTWARIDTLAGKPIFTATQGNTP